MASAQQIQNLQNQINDLNNRLSTQSTANLDPKVVKAYSLEYKNLNTQLQQYITNTRNYNFNPLVSDINKAKTSINNLGASINTTDRVFDKFFMEAMEGFKEVTKSVSEFDSVLTNAGGNIRFWREYELRIKSLGATFGLSGERLDQFKRSNRDIESVFVGTGREIGDLTEGIEALFNTTNETNQITPAFAKNLGNIAKVFDISTTEVGQFLGVFKNLNVSFDQGTAILDDLRYAAEKSALNTKKVVDEFSKNFEKLNTFSFKNGVDGMISMTKEAAKLKTDMNKILDLADQLNDPEKTMEFASNLQVLGGTFAQLGDFNQLMYDAAVAPEELAKNIAKATASMGTFNQETGKLDISFAERLQLKEASKSLNMTIEDLQKMATQAAKISDIKMSLNFKPLSEDQYDVLAAMSQFKGGKYTIDIDGTAKSVAELSNEDIDKLAQAQKDSMEDRRIDKMTVDEILVTKINQLKYTTPNILEASGMNDKNITHQVSETLNRIVNGTSGFLDQMKKGPIQSLEHMASGRMVEGLTKVLDNAGSAMGMFTNVIKSKTGELITFINDKDITKKYNEILSKQEKGSSVDSVGVQSKKYSEGEILKGKSHIEGGIPFTLNGKKGFEAEDGEVILTKGVSQDPALLTMASQINQMAGGKKLFKDGDVVGSTPSPVMSKIPDINVKNYNQNYNENFNEVNLPANRQIREEMRISKVLKHQEEQNITKLSRILPTIQQGGLINKRPDFDLNKMTVNGSIDIKGDIKFGEINIKINGESIKNIDNKELQKTIQDTILQQIKEELKKPNAIDLYHLTMNQKGSGLNEGGKDNSSWFRS
jgi:hypothetical protein